MLASFSASVGEEEEEEEEEQQQQQQQQQQEATILRTFGNSAGTVWDNTHIGLIDNAGIGGTLDDVGHSSSPSYRCAVSMRGSDERPFLSMKMATPKKVLRVQLAFRTDECCHAQGKNVRVQVGSSPQYDANDPVCKEIDQLSGVGLVDYHCDQVHEGQYITLSNDQGFLTVCEAKVFVEAG